ncbi:uncharacterized protein LOC114749841 isoform X1 [Neltuma alba]|uniref:uncharacterized protein LOC114749841 isoform X1 n=1 Tax=Neltuma alba TaxID=207710 RepID=UPI0010A30CB3|nr:uncharacterized protein LOC114749841 isoform X1 [Prosopis alba]
MSMIQLQRNLFTTTTSAPSFTFSPHPSSTALPLRRFCFMLQLRALQNPPISHSTWSVTSSIKCQKSSQVKFRKPGTMSIKHTSIGQSFCPFNGTSDVLRRTAVIPVLARPGFCKSVESLNNFSFPYPEKGFGRSLTNDAIFHKRYVSYVRKVETRNDTVNAVDGKHDKSTLGLKSSNKHKKRAKAFIVHGKDRDVTSGTSVSKDVDLLTSRKCLVEDKGLSTSATPANSKQDSKLNGRKKSGSKKNKNSVNNSSEEVAGAQDSINSSEANASHLFATGQSSSRISKKNSTKTASEEELDKPASKKKLSKKKVGVPVRKGNR